MDSFFKNIILVVSGFILALFIIKSPINSKSKYYQNSVSQQETKGSNRFSSYQRDSKSESPNLQTRKSVFSNKFNSSSRENLNSEVYSYSEHNENQEPTAPPDEDFNADQEDVAEEDEESEEKEQKGLANNNDNSSNRNKQEYKPKAKSAESSSNSAAQFVGATIVPKALTNQGSSTGSQVAVGSYGGGRRSVSDENSDSDVIPDNFTSSGLTTAKRLYSEGSISEDEYLDYLSLGLNSSETNLKNSALTELVGIRTQSAFLIQSQFASSSNANNNLIKNAVVQKYKSASDLRFLSQMIRDNSSVESQVWGIQALDVIIDGSNSNLDFTNQEIKNTLAQNVSTSLRRINSDHPSYDQARSIYNDINRMLS